MSVKRACIFVIFLNFMLTEIERMCPNCEGITDAHNTTLLFVVQKNEQQLTIDGVDAQLAYMFMSCIVLQNL